MNDEECNSQAIATESVSNERVIVTEWRFLKEGDDTGWHKHIYDYVVVPLFDGTLKIETEDGVITTAILKKGQPYYRAKGVRHNVINGNKFECAFIEIELR